MSRRADREFPRRPPGPVRRLRAGGAHPRKQGHESTMSDEHKKPPTKKPPFYLSYSSQRTNPKVAALTDAEYRAWHYALCSARLSVPAGQWPSRDYLAADLGRKYAKHIGRLIELDLLRVDTDGVVMSTNWDVNQSGLSDPTGAARQRAWRERERAKREAEATSGQSSAHVTRYAVTRNTDKSREDESRVDKTRLDTSGNETNSSVETLAVAYAAKAATAPSLTRQQTWTPAPCVRCGGLILDWDDAYEGDGPEAVSHINLCPFDTVPDEVDRFDE